MKSRRIAQRSHRDRNTTRSFILALALVAWAGCNPGEEKVPESSGPLPNWANRVYPSPGAQSTGVRAVEVHHRVLDRLENIHLEIDGTDVSQYARREPTLLHYDGKSPGSPVPLRPGDHTAEIRLVKLPELGAEGGETIDRFSWSFSIQ